MKSNLNCLYLIIIIFTASCQRELKSDVIPPITDTTTNPGTRPEDSLNSITGTWDFISVEAKTQSVSEINSAGSNQKAVAFLDYLSVENAGTVVIDDSSMTCMGITYKVFSKIKTFRYKNNTLIDSSEAPFAITFPTTDSHTLYEMITEDSIFFKKGSFTNISAVRYRVTPQAAKVALDRNSLQFIQNVSKDSVEVISGVTYRVIQRGEAVITLRRKL